MVEGIKVLFWCFQGDSPSWQELYISFKSDTVHYTVKSLQQEYILEEECVMT